MTITLKILQDEPATKKYAAELLKEPEMWIALLASRSFRAKAYLNLWSNDEIHKLLSNGKEYVLTAWVKYITDFSGKIDSTISNSCFDKMLPPRTDRSRHTNCFKYGYTFEMTPTYFKTIFVYMDPGNNANRTHSEFVSAYNAEVAIAKEMVEKLLSVLNAKGICSLDNDFYRYLSDITGMGEPRAVLTSLLGKGDPHYPLLALAIFTRLSPKVAMTELFISKETSIFAALVAELPSSQIRLFLSKILDHIVLDTKIKDSWLRTIPAITMERFQHRSPSLYIKLVNIVQKPQMTLENELSVIKSCIEDVDEELIFWDGMTMAELTIKNSSNRWIIYDQLIEHNFITHPSMLIAMAKRNKTLASSYIALMTSDQAIIFVKNSDEEKLESLIIDILNDSFPGNIYHILKSSSQALREKIFLSCTQSTWNNIKNNASSANEMAELILGGLNAENVISVFNNVHFNLFQFLIENRFFKAIKMFNPYFNENTSQKILKPAIEWVDTEIFDKIASKEGIIKMGISEEFIKFIITHKSINMDADEFLSFAKTKPLRAANYFMFFSERDIGTISQSAFSKEIDHFFEKIIGAFGVLLPVALLKHAGNSMFDFTFYHKVDDRAPYIHSLFLNLIEQSRFDAVIVLLNHLNKDDLNYLCMIAFPAQNFDVSTFQQLIKALIALPDKESALLLYFEFGALKIIKGTTPGDTRFSLFMGAVNTLGKTPNVISCITRMNVDCQILKVCYDAHQYDNAKQLYQLCPSVFDEDMSINTRRVVVSLKAQFRDLCEHHAPAPAIVGAPVRFLQNNLAKLPAGITRRHSF